VRSHVHNRRPSGVPGFRMTRPAGQKRARCEDTRSAGTRRVSAKQPRGVARPKFCLGDEDRAGPFCNSSTLGRGKGYQG
jgi:hypothetical protein